MCGSSTPPPAPPKSKAKAPLPEQTAADANAVGTSVGGATDGTPISQQTAKAKTGGANILRILFGLPQGDSQNKSNPLTLNK